MERYELLKTVGEGAYGFVYKAREKVHFRGMTDCDGCRKRIKFAPSNALNHRTVGETCMLDDSRVDQTIAKRELKACALLNHPNIVGYRGSFLHETLLHLVFDFEPSNLLRRIRRNPTGLPKHEARKIIYQLCKAVECCHSNSIMHRDIKPENILLDAEGNVKLCDFGVAIRIEHEGCPLTDYVATRWYRPPEQELRSKQYSFSADIWSIGCITAELLTGHTLFPGETQIQQLYVTPRAMTLIMQNAHSESARTTSQELQCTQRHAGTKQLARTVQQPHVGHGNALYSENSVLRYNQADDCRRVFTSQVSERFARKGGRDQDPATQLQ